MLFPRSSLSRRNVLARFIVWSLTLLTLVATSAAASAAPATAPGKTAAQLNKPAAPQTHGRLGQLSWQVTGSTLR